MIVKAISTTQVFGCRKKMSAIAILDYAGAETLFRQMEQHAEQGRREWEINHKEVSLLSAFTESRQLALDVCAMI